MKQRAPAEYEPCSKAGQQMESEVDRRDRVCKAFAAGQTRPSQHRHSVRLEDSKWFPFNGELPHIVRTRLRRGERTTVVDLAGVSSIDAAGIGDLVRAYNIAVASGGALRITNTNPWVREMLERVGLFERLDAGDTQDPDRETETLSAPTMQAQ
jgi:anti-anti-sigma factor